MVQATEQTGHLVDRAPSAAIADFLRGSVSISDLVSRVWSGRLIVIIFIVGGFVFGAYRVWRSGPSYLVTVKLVPAETDVTNSNTSGALGQLSDLMGSGSGFAVPRFLQFREALHSSNVAEILEKKYGMVCTVFWNYCNQKTGEWQRPRGIRAWMRGELAALGGYPAPTGERTAVDLAKYIKKSVSIEQDPRSHLLTLTYSSSRPEFALSFVTRLVRTTNDYLKDRDREVMQRYVAYLFGRIKGNTSIAQRSALDQLLLQQERKLMLTEVHVPYAASVLDGPTVEPKNGSLKHIALYGALGTFLGVFVALLSSYMRN